MDTSKMGGENSCLVGERASCPVSTRSQMAVLGPSRASMQQPVSKSTSLFVLKRQVCIPIKCGCGTTWLTCQSPSIRLRSCLQLVLHISMCSYPINALENANTESYRKNCAESLVGTEVKYSRYGARPEIVGLLLQRTKDLAPEDL